MGARGKIPRDHAVRWTTAGHETFRTIQANEQMSLQPPAGVRNARS